MDILYLNNGEKAIEPRSGGTENFPAANIDHGFDENNGSEATLATASF